MFSLPCYEIMGLSLKSNPSATDIDNAYQRVKDIISSDVNAAIDLDDAYDILRSKNTRDLYNLESQIFNESEWAWKEYEDDDGILRCLVRKVKNNFIDKSDLDEVKKNKKDKMKDRKGNRDKRRGQAGYDD